MASKFRSWWQSIQKRPYTDIVCALAFCRFGWYWIDSGGSPPPTQPSQRGKTLGDWIQFLLNPIILAADGFWLNQILTSRPKQRAEIERKAAEQHTHSEREIAADNQHEAALQGYIGYMSELLLHEHLRTSAPQDEVIEIARVWTVTVLPRLDASRKRSVLQFLYESGLIHKAKSIIHLNGAALMHAILSGADLSEAVLSEANLSEANLSEANLSGADLSRANLSNADLREAVLREADLRAAFLGEADLSRADLSGANLRETFLRAANMSRANLKKAALIQALLREANLTGASLTGANLGGSDLSRANLRAANLSEANLSETVLIEADLSRVNLSRANLTGANLSGAELSGTDLSRAKLVKALVTPEQLNEAKSLQDTTMPAASARLRRLLGKPRLPSRLRGWCILMSVDYVNYPLLIALG